MAKHPVRKLIGDSQLIERILIDTFEDRMPFGNLVEIVRGHLYARGCVDLVEILISELERRDFVADSSKRNAMAGPNKPLKPGESDTHFIGNKGLQMLMAIQNPPARVFVAQLRWLETLRLGGELTEHAERCFADDLKFVDEAEAEGRVVYAKDVLRRTAIRVAKEMKDKGDGEGKNLSEELSRFAEAQAD